LAISSGKTKEVPNLSQQDQVHHEKLNEERQSDDEILPLPLWDFLNEDDKNWVW
jgi:hypothetical protein